MALVLLGNEIVWVQGIAENGQPSAEQEQTTTQQIANLGGSGGVQQFVKINSGNSILGVLQTYYGWNSATNTAKNIVAPPATGSLHVISSIDMFGDAGGTLIRQANPINFVPNGSDIVIGGLTQIYTNNGQATWRDLAPGIWGLE